MSLTTCVRKAGDALRPEDKRAILEAARQNRKAGMSADEAAKAAVRAQLEAVQARIAELAPDVSTKTDEGPKTLKERAGAMAAKAEPVSEPASSPAPEKTTPAAEGGSSPTRADSAARRTNPRSTVAFAKPIVGPSGARLLSYTWQWKPMEFVDSRGEDRVKRISDWGASESSGDTGREVVHQFVVDDGGTEKVVSAESALKMLGFAPGSDGKAEFTSLSSAAKTLARLRMQQAEMEQAKQQFERDNAEVQAMALPVMPTERDAKGWFNMGDASVRQLEPGAMTDERRRALISAWRDNRMAERGWRTGSGEQLGVNLRDMADRIKRQQAKVDRLVTVSVAVAERDNRNAANWRAPERQEPLNVDKADDYKEAGEEAVPAATSEPPPMPPIGGIPREVAQRAHAGTSHVPEVRAGQEQESFRAALADAWATAMRAAGTDAAAQARVREVFDDVSTGYRERYLRTLEARSRVMSSMIAGPARFPVERNRKRMETERKRAEEAGEYLRRGIKRMLRAARGPIDNSPESELERVRLNLTQREEQQELMKAANAALRKDDDAALEDLGFTAEQIADLKKGSKWDRGFPAYKLTNNNAEIRRLRERLQSAEERMAAAQAGPVETERPGVRVVEDATDDRLRLIFDGKPSDEVREALKSAAFKWSPSASAWQRALTGNARYAAEQILNKFYPAGEQPALSRRMTPETRAANFGAWTEGTEVVDREAAATRGFKTGEAVTVEAYHGAARPDRVGTVFNPKRATSGPMAFFTADPVLASSYAQGKEDTSIGQDYEGDYAEWFKVKQPGERSARNIDQAWWGLSPDERSRIAELAPRVTSREDDDGGYVIELGDESVTAGVGSYDYELSKTARNSYGGGNPLRALVESWLASGWLFNEEIDFLKVLRLAGFPMDKVEYASPREKYPFVYKTFIRMANPLVTSDVPPATMQALEAMAARDRSRAQPIGADTWDKNTITPREWVSKLKDQDRGSYAWTSIPDKVTDVLRGLGYDGIVDWSGKGGGDIVAPVYIPFAPEQIKSAIGNKGTYDPTKKDILKSRATDRPAGFVSPRTLRDEVAKITATWSQDIADVEVVNRVEDLPADIRNAVRNVGSENTVRGLAMPDGRVYLVAENIRSLDEGRFVLFHEVYGHVGMRAFLGDGYATQMKVLRSANPALAREADAWFEQYGEDEIAARVAAGFTEARARADVQALAVEEALADRAGDAPAVKGWKLLLAALQRGLRRLGLGSVADMLEGMTEAETMSLLVEARRTVQAGQRERGLGLAPAMSRSDGGLTRRNLMLGMAAAVAPGASAAGVTVGRAKPVSEALFNQQMPADIAKALRGNGSRTTNLEGAKVVREALDKIAATGPAELRVLAKQVRAMMPDKNLMLTVDDTGLWNAHGAVTWDVGGPHLKLFTAEGRTGLTYGTFLHETLHVGVLARYQTLSTGVMRENDKVLGLSAPAASKELEQFRQLYEEFRAEGWKVKPKDDDTGLSVREAMRSPDEFFVRALTDGRLQEFMAGIEYRGKSMLERFKDWVKSALFGLSREGTAPSWLDAALLASQELATAMGRDPADFNRLRAINRLNSQRSALFSRRQDFTPPPEVATGTTDQGHPEFASGAVTIAFPQPAERFEVIPEPGQEVLSYAIMPPDSFDVLGHVELLVENGLPVSLLDIEVYSDKGRGKGVGRAVIEALLAANPDADLNISNIVEDARGVWERMGVPQQNLEQGAAYEGTLNWKTYSANNRAAGRNAQGRGGARQAGNAEGAGAREGAAGQVGPVFSRGIGKATAQDMLAPTATRKRDLTQRLRNTLADQLGSAGAKVSWFDRTLGTQYAKAEKFPEFKRVFEHVQQYLEDTSTMANEAADKAKSILPKLETWRDLKTFGISEADAKAVAGPIFTGTLTDSKVYDDAELKSRWKLTEPQIKAYREFLSAVNTSLDQAVTADVVRILGDKNPALREVALTDRAEFRRGVLEFLADQIEQNGEDIMASDDAAGEWTKLQRKVAAQYKRIADLKEQGYAPLMRFGKYKVHIASKDGETLFFGLYESAGEANAMARDLAADPEFKGATVEQGVLSQEQYRLFSQIPLDSMELFANAIGANEAAVFQEYLKLAKSNRSAMKRLIKRKGTAGFSQDVPRVLAAFVTSNARMASGGLNLMAAKEAAQDIGAGDVKDEAIKLLDTVQNPTETAGFFRGLMFVNFIGGSIASAVVNLTQPVTMTLPYLSQFGGAKKAAARLMAAGKMVASGKVDDLALRAALKRAEADGIVSPQEIHFLTAQAMGSWGRNPILQRAAFIWSAPFSLAEQFNRRASFIAAYVTAKEQGIEDPFAFAEKAVVETQGLYNKGNAPNWARNPIGASALTFRQFSIHYMEWLARMYRSGPEGKKAVLLALALLMLFAGTDGLPGADDMDDLVDTAGQALGFDTNFKKSRREFIANELGFGDEFADVLARGITALPGIPLDASLRMSMGNLIPGTGLLLRSNTDTSRDLLEVAGPAGGIAKQYLDAAGKALDGNVAGAALGAVPVAIQNAAKGIGMWESGEARDTRDRRIMDADAVDGLMKFVGFQPQAIARESEKLSMIRRSEQLAKNIEGDIAEKWARAFADGDSEGVADAKQALADWNERNPESRIRITGSQILRRVKQLRKDRASRFITSVSPERRGAVVEALQE